MTGVESTIEPFWSGNHQFFLRKKGWSWLGANVKVDIVVADKADMTDQHMLIKPVKVPADVSIGANVAPGQATNARDQVMNVTSNIGAAGSFLNHRVTFAVNSSAVVGDQATKLENVVKTFKGAESSPGVADARSIQTPVVLTGRASRDRRPGPQPGALRAARGGGRGLHAHQGLRQRGEARQRLGRRRHDGRRRRERERPPRRHRDRLAAATRTRSSTSSATRSASATSTPTRRW